MTAPLGASVRVQDAVHAALITDDDLAAYCGGSVRCFEGLAPPATPLRDAGDAPWPYLTLSGGEEDALNVFGASGYEAGVEVRVWVPDVLERLAKIGAEHVRRILDGAPLVLTEYVTLSATVERMSIFPDPDYRATQARRVVRVHAQ